MTDEQLATLEKMHADVAISAVAEIFQHFPEIAKELREARAERDNLAHELKCSNETIDMLYQRSSNFAQQADTHEAEAKRLKDIVETYDDRFATLYDEKNREIAALKKDLRDIKGAYDYYRKHAASILNNTADPEET